MIGRPGELAAILIVDDEPDVRLLLHDLCREWGYHATPCSTPDEAAAACAHTTFDCALVDLHLAGDDGVALLRRLRQCQPWIECIVITGDARVEQAVRAVRSGAFEYLTKPVSTGRLEIALRNAVEHARRAREILRLRGSADAFATIAGKNPRLRQAVETARRAAATNVPVLLVGETGTGKELFAHAIHAASPRSGGPFVAVNCSAIPESLAESELFGHEAGAFTGAAARRAGCFERAHGGTLFLDEIEAMPPAVQPKILRILQDCRGVRIGGTQPFAADARIFAATNRDPEALVREERLRADLFHRIGAITIRIPALRERPEDVPLLADLCLRRACERIGKPPLAWSAETIALLVRYSWPGNVREMENVSLHAALHADTDTVLPDHLPEALRQPDAPSPQAVEISLDAAVEALERWMIADALRRSGGVQTRAAELLGTTKRVIGYNIQKYGLAARPEP